MRKTIYSVLAIVLIAGTAAFAGVNHSAKAKNSLRLYQVHLAQNTPKIVFAPSKLVNANKRKSSSRKAVGFLISYKNYFILMCLWEWAPCIR